MKKIYVMIGNYGSGKSELALNFAFKAAETGKTELIDLDLVNTYFRLTERGKLVEQKEIRLISPNYACSGVETLSLPAEVASAFAMNWDTVVFDVGGDAVGSTALGRYYEDFQDFMAMGPEQLEVLNVVNIRRPLAGTVESCEYYGLYIKYYIHVGTQSLKVIEKNDGVNIYDPGQRVKVILNPNDIMAYAPSAEEVE